jgi:hypothetical protein
MQGKIDDAGILLTTTGGWHGPSREAGTTNAPVRNLHHRAAGETSFQEYQFEPRHIQELLAFMRCLQMIQGWVCRNTSASRNVIVMHRRTTGVCWIGARPLTHDERMNGPRTTARYPAPVESGSSRIYNEQDTSLLGKKGYYRSNVLHPVATFHFDPLPSIKSRLTTVPG